MDERLERLKMSLNIDFTDKDKELGNLLKVAEAYTCKMIDKTLSDVEEFDVLDSEAFEGAVILHARISFETGGTMVPNNGSNDPMSGYWKLVNSLK